MIKKIKVPSIFILLMYFILMMITDGLAFNEEITHPHLTRYATAASNLPNYLTTNLGIQEDINRIVTFTGNDQNGIAINRQKKIYEWLMSGSIDEDLPMCRASNHFHNPLLPWSQSFMSDDTTGAAAAIRLYCNNSGWPYDQRKSNVVWATGLLEDGSSANTPDNLSTDPPSPNTWNKARGYYYKALTKDIGTVRDTYLARTFQAVGQVMHLLEDVAVPAHVRNDFQSHLAFTGVNSINFTRWFNNLFEFYVKNNDSNIMPNLSALMPSFSTVPRLPDFWDTEQYTPETTNPSSLVNLGLAEYTNLNFVSDYTFSTSQTSPVTPEHYFKFPSVDSSVSRVTVTINDPVNSGAQVPREYYKKTADGDTGYLLAGVDYLKFRVESISPVNPEQPITYIAAIIPPMDDYVHQEYADRLLPRAVGYSAGLLNYFFRGNIQITLPDSGTYASADDSGNGFTTVKVLAKNTTANNEAMDDGTIELVVKYKQALEDPFKNYPEDHFLNVSDFMYIVAPVKNGIRGIPGDHFIELIFDLPTALPFWAIDVYLQVVYHGTLGNEDNAVAVGFKDISEPTPIDMSSDTDRICMNGTFFTAGSPEAIGLVDTNNDGIADLWDVYKHSQKDIYVKISSQTDPKNASPTDYTFSIPALAAGGFARNFYILTDEHFSYSIVETWVNDNQSDPWSPLPSQARLYTGDAIKNQTDYVDSAALCSPLTAPCYIWWYPEFLSYRNRDEWWGSGVMYINNAYPQGSECSCYQGIVDTCSQ